jgi:hypothetical protein
MGWFDHHHVHLFVKALLGVVDEFKVTTELLSSSAMPTIECSTIIFWVGYNK